MGDVLDRRRLFQHARLPAVHCFQRHRTAGSVCHGCPRLRDAVLRLPVYRYVAGESPHGQGSIAMLEGLLHGWASKFLVLILLGFAATDFVITKTLSAADAAEHLVHNPMWNTLPPWLHSRMLLTMFLLVLLGTVFLRGFREVIGVAVVVVTVYLALNVVVIVAGLACLVRHPDLVSHWLSEVGQGNWHMEEAWPTNRNFGMLVVACFLYFPKLALGLSGFETGVAVMPLIKGNDDDDPHRPAGRIAHTRKLLLTAAVIMSCMLLGSAVVTCTLIPPEALLSGGKAANRALAFLAHGESPTPMGSLFGETFGTVYDVTTVVILWFAGASAMSGLLNLVPRYLPRYGMAPRWAEAFRPLVILFTCVGLFVTWVFDASVEQQGGAYATGVMVLISSACVAVVIDEWRKRGKQLAGSRDDDRRNGKLGVSISSRALALRPDHRRVSLHDRRDRDRKTSGHQDRRRIHRRRHCRVACVPRGAARRSDSRSSSSSMRRHACCGIRFDSWNSRYWFHTDQAISR